MGISKAFFRTIVIAFLCLSVVVSAADKAKKADVRLLIDISGSMKKNDPNNLRIPALQLVTNLLPKGADAGVWAFGKYVNMMVPLKPVNSAWQAKATNTAKKINSAGLYTNIGLVLEKASFGWNAPNSSEKRSMVLLTDGMVDISKDPSVNAKERQRILTKVLPKLKKAGVAIHTIALSENADHELMKELSSQTDGWYRAVNNAEELQKIFLKIFEQAAERDNLPISDNKFSVDASIDEMTVLIFRQKGSQPSKLTSPTGQTYSEQEKQSGLRWFSTNGYDLVTIQKPEVGDWKINAKVDPDNRVMVVSKLGLMIEALPNNLLAGEAINYELKLLEEGKVIKKSDFLNLVDARLDQTKDGKTSKLAMFFDQANSAFKQNFYTDSFEGELKLKLLVKSPTFERERSHAINIYGSPLITEVVLSPDNIQPHKINLSLRDDIVDTSGIEITATIESPDGEKSFQVIGDYTKPLEIKADLTGGRYKVDFKISGRSVLGRAFEVSPESVEFEVKSLIDQPVKNENNPAEKALEEPKRAEEEPKQDKPKQEEPKEAEVKVQEPEETEKPTEAVEAEESGINWIYVGIAGNLLLGIIGFFVWRMIKKKNSAGAAALADEIGFDDEEEDDDDDEIEDDDEEEKD